MYFFLGKSVPNFNESLTNSTKKKLEKMKKSLLQNFYSVNKKSNVTYLFSEQATV